MNTSNELRVFISSTFRDLQEEREHLIKKIFPEIRSLCRARGITFTEVDLRWGLTEEEQALGRIIRTCLEEIDKCRPYFIGITGERYGYVPDLIEIYKDPELLRQYPWIEDAVMDSTSIIDMEFRYGVFDWADESQTARFFFKKLRRGLDAAADSEEARRLDGLKQRVRDAGLSVEEFRDPVSLGEAVYDELVEIIRRDFADISVPTELEQERAQHAAFAASRRNAYIPNPVYLKQLNEWVAGDEPPLILYAESGSGKSSLVSFWCEQHRRRNPDAFVVEHYVGIGAGDTDHLGLIRHVMSEIKDRYDRSETIPTKPEELERDFANWLGFVRTEGEGNPSLILVLDGINQLHGRALTLGWLPKYIPPGVRLIVSSTVEQTLVHLRERGWGQLGMQPLNEREREAVTVRYLSEYHKSLSVEQIRRIAEDQKCSHPLFLRVLLEELRLYGVHERLDSELDRLLGTTGTEDLFQQVLERLEDDFSQKTVREVLSLLWASRLGLGEAELSEVSGISRLKLTSLLFGLDFHLVRRDGVLTFFHDYLRRAVEKRYLSAPTRQKLLRRELATYFARMPVDERTARERIYQLSELEDWEGLLHTMAEMPVFRVLCREGGDYEYQTHARTVSERHDLVAALLLGLNRYRSTSPSEDQLLLLLEQLADFFRLTSRWSEAQPILQAALECAIRLDDRTAQMRVYVALGWIQLQQRKYDESMTASKQSLAIAHALDDTRGIAQATRIIGIAHFDFGELSEARERFLEDLELRRQLNHPRELATVLMNLANVTRQLPGHDQEQPQEYYRQALEIAQTIGDRLLVATVLFNMGGSRFIAGDHKGAIADALVAQEIFLAVGNISQAARNGRNMGVIHIAAQQWEEAQVSLLSSLDYAELCDDTMMELSLCAQMARLYTSGFDGRREHEILHWLERTLELAIRLDSKPEIQESVQRISDVAVSSGDAVRAQDMGVRALQLAEELGATRPILIAHCNLGVAYNLTGDHALAIEHADCAIALVGNDTELAVVLVANKVAYLVAQIAEHSSRHDSDDLQQQVGVIRKLADDAIARAAETGRRDQHVEAMVSLARLENALGNLDAAVEQATALLDEAVDAKQRERIETLIRDMKGNALP